MRVAVRRIDRHAAFAGIGAKLDMARPERQRLAAAAGQHNGAGMEPFHFDARHRPGVGPRPRLCRAAAGDGFRKGPLQQNLRDDGLGVDVGALAEQHEAGEGEKRGAQ